MKELYNKTHFKAASNIMLFQTGQGIGIVKNPKKKQLSVDKPADLQISCITNDSYEETVINTNNTNILNPQVNNIFTISNLLIQVIF